MSAAEYSFAEVAQRETHNHLFRIVNPCESVIITRERENLTDALAWLLVVQMTKKDPFLELERFDGARWISRLDANFDCCTAHFAKEF